MYVNVLYRCQIVGCTTAWPQHTELAGCAIGLREYGFDKTTTWKEASLEVGKHTKSEVILVEVASIKVKRPLEGLLCLAMIH